MYDDWVHFLELDPVQVPKEIDWVNPTQPENIKKKKSSTAPTKLLNGPKPKPKAHVLPTSNYLSLCLATLYMSGIRRCTRLVFAVLSLSHSVWHPPFDLEFETLSLGLSLSNLLCLFLRLSLSQFHSLPLSLS